MCPLCVGSALLALTGTGSAGGLALLGARALRFRRASKTPELREIPLDPEPRTQTTATGGPTQLQ